MIVTGNVLLGFRAVCVLFLLLAALPTRGLIFPLLPNAQGEYDVNHNVVPSYSTAWTNGHAVYNLHGANAVAIAPHWLMTAWHLAQYMDTNFWVNDDNGRYYIQERYQVSGELALLRVDRELPFYSELRKTVVGMDELLTIYGSSAAAGEPIYDSLGDPVGWTLAPTTHHPGLRWGQARSLGDPWVLQWLFTRGDPLLGPDGINCAGIATNDSGGGIFTGSQVAGVTYGGNFSAFRLAMNAPRHDCSVGLLFTTTNLWHCGENKLLPPSRAHGVVVHPYLSTRLSSTRRICQPTVAVGRRNPLGLSPE